MSEFIKYLMGLEPAQMKEAIAALSPEKREELAQLLCHNINTFASQILKHKDHIWLTGELPP